MKALANVIKSEWSIALLLGGLSIILAFLKFQFPGIEAATSDLREIPLLIAILYIRKPPILLIAAGLTTLNVPSDSEPWTILLMHMVGMAGFWFYYEKWRRKNLTLSTTLLLWIGGVLLYYYALLIPTMVITYRASGFNLQYSPFEFYLEIASGVQFELMITTMITTLFMAQFYTRQRLQKNLRRLEFRNQQLAKYAWMNSHTLRAPVARLQGLANLMKIEEKSFDDPELLSHFAEACEELDDVVHSITKTLENEGTPMKPNPA